LPIMSSPDFGNLPPEYQHLLRLAKEEHHLDVVPLEALSGGQTGAFLFLVSVSVGDARRVEHFVVKFDRANAKAKTSEVERHRLALSQAPPAFASQNMPKLAYAVEHEGAIALFYTLAGQSLQNYRTLGSNERQSRLEILFDATNNYLLQEWNAEATVEQALHPQKLLARWLGYRLKPDGLIASFLQDQFRLEPDTEGFLIQGHIFPNPLGYGLDARRWKDTRSIDALMGLQHGDLNIGNILAKFQDDTEELKGYFLIDFALYKAQMPLLYDQCYLEMSYLVRELNRVSLSKWVTLVSHFASRDMPNPKDVPVELGGACAVINAGRRSFERWVQDTHPSLSDDLWGQRWLAAVAAGLNFCNKAALSTEARLAGLIFSAVHLKRYCAQFSVPLPLEVRLLYDASQGAEIAATSQAAPAPTLRPDGPSAQPIPATDRQAKTPPSLPSGTVTFLFTDIESSSKLWEQHPEAMKAVLARHDAILHGAVEAHHGRVIKTTGDGIHAVFDAAAHGLDAALAAQQALFAETWAEIQPEAVRVRMALHTGEAEARAGDYYGPALNRAARLMSIGHGGQTLLSATTAELVQEQLPAGATLRDLGEHSLRDLARAEHVFQLVYPDLPTDFPPLKSLKTAPNNLPVQLTTFVGREAQVQAVKDLLLADAPGVRLVTLTGPGGTGKTRLAVHTAAAVMDSFDDGEFFVDLAPIREPEPVLAAIAQVVGLRQTSERPLFEALTEELKARRLLLLLDNFEQVTAAAPKVADLLRGCLELKVLVTSREALRVRGEHVYPIPPLTLPAGDLKQLSVEQLTRVEAIRLFIERAQAVKPDFALTEQNAAAVAEICLRLDGLPLAIELASARIRLFTPQALLERVGSRLKLLRGGARDLALRQQTLRAAIDWSYDLLDSGEQALFALLSLFAGFTYDAVDEVASGMERLDETGVDVLDGLASLVDKSLIRQVEQDNGC
jgi:predicted ATPase/class 3 adenylate cyclase